ncbi:MAG: hypothetical protein K9N21_07870 [Deltaproteobacteria bacterium]|nr:hypothetical protein [Deltaproteobacteria bacterium]
MLLKIWLMNVILAVAVFFAGMKSIEVWTERRTPHISSTKGTLAWTEKSLEKKTLPPEADYEVVVSNNLFFADRSEILEKSSTNGPASVQQAVGAQLQGLELAIKQMNLYGVIMVGDHKEALIASASPVKRPGTPAKDGVKRAREGDMVGKFKVEEIRSTSALLTAGGYEWQITIFDKDNPKKRVPVKKEAGPIVVGADVKPEAGKASGGDEEKAPVAPPAIPAKGRAAPGTGEAPGGERKNGQSPVPPGATQAMPEKTANQEQTTPESPRINPATIWRGSPPPMPNLPRPAKR